MNMLYPINNHKPIMLIQQSVFDLIEELNKVIGDKLMINVNAYVQSRANEGCCLFIDPSGLSVNDENRITDYARQSGLIVDEAWNDWGRFIKIILN